MALKIGHVEFYVGPRSINQQDDLEKVIVDFIKGARKTLDIAVQELDNRKIANAIIAARTRKVTVSLILENDYLREKKARARPFTAGGANEVNRQIHSAIMRSNIKVNTDYNPKIFHQKFMVRDAKEVLTGSTNFTDTGVGENLNHIVIVRDKRVAKIYGKEFREIEQGHFGKLNEGHDPKPRSVNVSELPIKILFAPDHSPEMEIMKQMLKAKNRIDFAIFTFSESSGIDDTLIQMARSGVAVQGVFDPMQVNQSWSPAKAIKRAGADLHSVRTGGGLNKLHHKLMVIDDRVVIAGSFNYTGPANRLNDENIMIIGDQKTRKLPSATLQDRFGRFARDEIDRIIQNNARPL